tara:strand:+ start:217 stop:390 length:174 start_codon:yes stop_codon:yes gene_type:complete
MKIMNDKTELNWGMIILLILNASYWVCVWKFGFFLPTIWTIIIAAIVGLWLRLTGRS